MNELYKILGVAPTVSTEELKKAYRAAAKKMHPDLHPDDLDAEVKFKRLNEAYSILGDDAKRKAYDKEQLAKPRKPPQENRPKTAKRAAPQSPTDFSNMQQSFSAFFGFDPTTGDITDENQLKQKKNPLDTSGLFEKFMGFK